MYHHCEKGKLLFDPKRASSEHTSSNALYLPCRCIEQGEDVNLGSSGQRGLPASLEEGGRFLCLLCAVLSRSVMPRLFAIPWTIAHQAPLSMGFPRQEYWSELPCPPPEDLPNPGIKPRSLGLQADPLLSEPPGKPNIKK